MQRFAVGVAALPRVMVIFGEGFAFWFVGFFWLVTVKTFLVPDPEVMLMMTAEDVVLPGVFSESMKQLLLKLYSTSCWSLNQLKPNCVSKRNGSGRNYSHTKKKRRLFI